MVNHGPSADGWRPSCRAEILAGLLWNLRGILWQNTGGGRKWMVLYGWHMHTYIYIYISLMEEENISWYLIFAGFIWVSLKCDHVVLICIDMIHCRLRMFNSHLYRCIVKRCACVPISPSTWQPCYGNVWPPKWIDPKAVSLGCCLVFWGGILKGVIRKNTPHLPFGWGKWWSTASIGAP